MSFFIKFIIFILFFSFISCSSEDDQSPIYSFPPLSVGKLIDLKKTSEKMEGFFITTDLSDWDSSWAERGFYVYVCIRFLNDKTVNQKLDRSAIPLLVQVSNDKDKPEAESVILLHPKTLEDGSQWFFPYQERTRKRFQFAQSSISVKDTEYNIFDVILNKEGKITNMSFLKNGVTLEALKEAMALENGETNIESSAEMDQTEEELAKDNGTNKDKATEEETASAENTTPQNVKDLVLEVGSFAKQFSSSCEKWPVLNYTHSNEVPDYLTVDYKASKGEANGTGEEGSPPVTNNKTPIPQQNIIPEDAPYNPMS